MNSSPAKGLPATVTPQDIVELHDPIERAQQAHKAQKEQRAEVPAILSEAELYKYKYLTQCLVNTRMRHDMHSVEVQRASADAVKLQEELQNFQKDLGTKYDRDPRTHVVTDTGEFIPREQLVGRR